MRKFKMAKVANTASSVLTVATPWSGTVFKTKSQAPSRSRPSLPAISYRPSDGEPNKMRALEEALRASRSSPRTFPMGLPSLEVPITK